MNKRLLAAVIIGATVALSGCNERGTPDSVTTDNSYGTQTTEWVEGTLNGGKCELVYYAIRAIENTELRHSGEYVRCKASDTTTNKYQSGKATAYRHRIEDQIPSEPPPKPKPSLVEIMGKLGPDEREALLDFLKEGK